MRSLCPGREVNVVSYNGSLASREVVQAHELWLQPNSMDGRSATTQSRENLPDKVTRSRALAKTDSYPIMRHLLLLHMKGTFAYERPDSFTLSFLWLCPS